jgi:hypothetical protein
MWSSGRVRRACGARRLRRRRYHTPSRKLTPKSQYGINLMHISVDGKPIDDPDGAPPT